MTEADPGSGGGAVGGSVGMIDPPPAVGERGRPGSAAARPLVLHEPFDGTGSWSDWWFHFKNVSTVNGWDDTQKMQWLRVRWTRSKGAASSSRACGLFLRRDPEGTEGEIRA